MVATSSRAEVRIFLWRHRNGEEGLSLWEGAEDGLEGMTPFETATDLNFSQCSSYLVCGTTDGIVNVWDVVDTFSLVRQINTRPWHNSTLAVDWVNMTPRGVILASAGQFLTMWSVDSGLNLGTFNAGAHTACAMKGSAMVIAGLVVQIRHCNTVPLCLADLSEAGEGAVVYPSPEHFRWKYQGHEETVLCMSISASGEYLVTGSADSTARVWSMECGKLIQMMRGHRGAVTAVGFVNRETHVASVGVEGRMRLWDCKSGCCIRVIKTPYCAFSTLGDLKGLWVVQYKPTPDGRVEEGEGVRMLNLISFLVERRWQIVLLRVLLCHKRAARVVTGSQTSRLIWRIVDLVDDDVFRRIVLFI
jgi:WD40 repeat protein